MRRLISSASRPITKTWKAVMTMTSVLMSAIWPVTSRVDVPQAMPNISSHKLRGRNNFNGANYSPIRKTSFIKLMVS